MRLYDEYLVDWCDQWFYVWLSVGDEISKDMNEIGPEHSKLYYAKHKPCKYFWMIYWCANIGESDNWYTDRLPCFVFTKKYAVNLCYFNMFSVVLLKIILKCWMETLIYCIFQNWCNGLKPRYHQTTNTSLRCSWSIACRRCSNNIFILDLAPGFIGLGKDSCKTRRETFTFWELLRLT